MSKPAKKYRVKARKGAAVPPGPGTYNVIEYAILQAGFNEAQRACTMIASWLIAREGLKRWPASIDEYSDWWNQSHQTGYRELASFRRCFPMYSTPTELCVDCKLRVPFAIRRDNDPAAVAAYLTQRKLVVA